MAKLFEEYLLKDVKRRNRIVVSPMCQYCSEDGFPNDWHMVHLGSRAVGGAGLVMVEATAVSPEGRISRMDSGIWSDAHIDPFSRIAKFMKDVGLDLLDVSHGMITPDHSKVPSEPGFMVPYASRIRKEANIPVIVGWLITEPKQAEQILANDRADLIVLARELLRDPYWPFRAAKALGDDMQETILPVQYARAVQS